MPIVLKDFSWHQNSETLLLKVDTGNAKPTAKNCTVTVTSQYIKMSLVPFLFEMFLEQKIETGQSNKITFGINHVALTLQKAEPGLEWQSIEASDLSREQKQQKRQQAELETQQWHQSNEEALKAKSESLRKSGIQKQLEQMEQSRKRIERVKQEMVSQALADTLQWKQTLPDHSIYQSSKQIKELEPENKDKRNSSLESEDDQDDQTEPAEPVEMCISFTPRVYPTPKRESCVEMEGKMKQQREEALKLAGYEPENLESADPGWMYQKAKDLVESGNNQGGAALASHALAACPTHGGLRLVLAVAFLHLGNWFQAVECCSRALEVATLDKQMRAQLVAVRGVALVKSGRHLEGRNEIKIGLSDCELDPLLQTLSKDLQVE